MRRTFIIAALVVATIASAIAYQRSAKWKPYSYPGTRLMADLGKPDALIRSSSLSSLPKDLLKVPMARDVFTEDLVFYYENNEDRLSFKGAVKRIAYEHQLAWTDRILASALDEPAEVAMWRDGRGALRHFAIVMRRNLLTKLMQQAGTVAMSDAQLKRAGKLTLAKGEADIFALELNPRRTLLIVSYGDRVAVLSDPGLLYGKENAIAPEARTAVAAWLENDGALSRGFALEPAAKATGATHTLVIGAPVLTLGYTAFFPGFKGLRFDFNTSTANAWSTQIWLDDKAPRTRNIGDVALWRAVPANPAACLLLPVDWKAAQAVVTEADKQPQLPDAKSLAALDGSAVACWYADSSLYAPVFIGRITKELPDRNQAIAALATWAMRRPGAVGEYRKTPAKSPTGKKPAKDDTLLWRAQSGEALQLKGPPSVAARGSYVVFSPDGDLVDQVLDTIARVNPSVADQMPTSDATLALLTPRPLSSMTEREAMGALSGPGDASQLAAVRTHLPARMAALATHPAYRLDLAGKNAGGWQRVEWRAAEAAK